VALRSTELRRLIGNLGEIANELGANENQLTSFVTGNEGTWRAFAAQDQALGQTIRLLPGALASTNTALVKAEALSHTLQSAFGQLEPSVRSLGPTLADLRLFFDRTTPVLKNDLRPFAVKAQPAAKVLAPATHKLAASTPGLKTLAQELNNIVNELAYKPQHGQSYLFYVPWANHDTNSVLAAQDGVGPVRQSMLIFTCGTLSLLQGFLANPDQNPTLTTLVQLLHTPSYTAHCRGTLPK
jgi:phospholipid/cholesterol/gamma-HCH transport system substrate-binding protein